MLTRALQYVPKIKAQGAPKRRTLSYTKRDKSSFNQVNPFKYIYLA